MWKCPICQNEEKSKYICEKCGYDTRNDFVQWRTICNVPEQDVKKRSDFAINERTSKVFIKGNVKFNPKEDTSKKNKFWGNISTLFMIAVIGLGIILIMGKKHVKESYETKDNRFMNEFNYGKVDSKKELEKKVYVEEFVKDWLDIYLEFGIKGHMCEIEYVDITTVDQELVDLFGIQHESMEVLYKILCCTSYEELEQHRLSYFSKSVLDKMEFVLNKDEFKEYKGALYWYRSDGFARGGYPEESVNVYVTNYDEKIEFSADLLSSGSMYIWTEHFVLTYENGRYVLTGHDVTYDSKKEGKIASEIYF